MIRRFSLVLLLAAASWSCAAIPIDAVLSPGNGSPVGPPAPPIVVDPPKPPDPPQPEIEWRDLAIVVHDAAGKGIGGARCQLSGHVAINGQERTADGAGFIHFPVPGVVFAACRAEGYEPVSRELPPGGHRIGLIAVPVAPIDPDPLPTPFRHCYGAEFDGLSCVREVAEIYPWLLNTNTYESCLEFTQRVLEQLGPEYGHVGKTAGESQSVPRGFQPVDVVGSDGVRYRITGVSHDAIKHRVTGQVIDLLANASANSDPDPKIHGPASPIWNEIPSQFWRPSNPFIPAVKLPSGKDRN